VTTRATTHDKSFLELLLGHVVIHVRVEGPEQVYQPHVLLFHILEENHGGVEVSQRPLAHDRYDLLAVRVAVENSGGSDGLQRR